MLVQSPEGKMEVIDFREVAPGSSTRDMFGKERNASVTVRSYVSFILRSYSRDSWRLSLLFAFCREVCQLQFQARYKVLKWLIKSLESMSIKMIYSIGYYQFKELLERLRSFLFLFSFRLKWKDLFSSPISIARNGFKMHNSTGK